MNVSLNETINKTIGNITQVAKNVNDLFNSTNATNVVNTTLPKPELISEGLNPISNPINNPLPPTESVVEISRLNIWSLIMAFLVAVGLHVIIAVVLNQTKKEILEKGETEELLQKLKVLNLLFRWYPAGAVVVLILFLLL